MFALRKISFAVGKITVTFARNYLCSFNESSTVIVSLHPRTKSYYVQSFFVGKRTVETLLEIQTFCYLYVHCYPCDHWTVLFHADASRALQIYPSVGHVDALPPGIHWRLYTDMP